MQGKLASIATALILTLTPDISLAAKKPIKKPTKTFDLNLKDQSISHADDSLARKLEFEEPSAGEESLVQQMKLRPEFKYAVEDDDYNSRNNEYDRQIKLRLNLDF